MTYVNKVFLSCIFTILCFQNSFSFGMTGVVDVLKMFNPIWLMNQWHSEPDPLSLTIWISSYSTVVMLAMILAVTHWIKSSNNTMITGSGIPGTKMVSLENIHTISASGDVKLDIQECTSGNTETVTATTDDNILRYLTMTNNNGTLTLEVDCNAYSSETLPSFVVVLNENSLKKLVTSGSVTTTASTISTKDFILNCNGSNTTTIKKITCRTLTVESKGNNKITVNTGTATKQNINTEGCSTYDALNLNSEEARINASGSTQVTVNIEKCIDAFMSGSSLLNYRDSSNGAPLQQNIRRTGAAAANKNIIQ